MQAQGGGAQMAAQQGRIDAQGLSEGVLGALDGVFRLRRGGAALHPALDLKGQRPDAGKQHDAEAMNQPVGALVRIRAGQGNRVVYICVEGGGIELGHGPRLHGHQRPEHILGKIAAGNQAVDGIEDQLLSSRPDGPGLEIVGALKRGADGRVCDLTA